jgi:magnesium-transporting ATPase (P-type)
VRATSQSKAHADAPVHACVRACGHTLHDALPSRGASSPVGPAVRFYDDSFKFIVGLAVVAVAGFLYSVRAGACWHCVRSACRYAPGVRTHSTASAGRTNQVKRFLYFHMETREMVLDACDLVTVVVPPALPTAMVTLPRCPFAGSTP